MYGELGGVGGSALAECFLALVVGLHFARVQERKMMRDL